MTARWHSRAERRAVTSRRGQFWIPGELVPSEFGTTQRGPMFVMWEAPAAEVGLPPVVLVHGGGGQGTDWLGTPDGRPGWADLLVAAGYPIYVVDRVGHGRSPYHPDVLGPMGPPAPHEWILAEFAPDEQAERQTQWTAALDEGQLLAPAGPMPVDQAFAQDLDADRLAGLLDLIGPAYLVTHSAGGPAGWVTVARRPDLVLGVAAIEPVGPLFADIPGYTHLKSGLASSRLPFDSDIDDVEAVWTSEPDRLRLPCYRNKPVLLITSETSGYSDFTPGIAAFLTGLGADVEWTHLPELGIHGNGHALIYEANSETTIKPLLAWLSAGSEADTRPTKDD